MACYSNLLSLCIAVPPDIRVIEAELRSGGYSPDDVTECAIAFADECSDESRNYYDDEPHSGPKPESLHSSFLFELISLFLRFGLNPNAVYGETGEQKNIMASLCFMFSSYYAADTMRLLLEHGGDMNIMVDDEPLFEAEDFDVVFGAIEQENRCLYDSEVHLWLVMVGYGGKTKIRQPPVQMKNGYCIDILREHERFDFCIEHDTSYEDGWRMLIFEKNTKDVVAVL